VETPSEEVGLMADSKTIGQRLIGVFENAWNIVEMPTITAHLMYRNTIDNHPFYRKLTKDFHQEMTEGHTKFPLVGQYEWGTALCVMPRTFEEYFMMVDAAARRNYKKAQRMGYRFARIDPNNYLKDIKDIRISTDTRQGKVADSLYHGDVKINTDPPSTSKWHDYPYYGVFKDERLVAYASCFVAGEVCFLQHILGHAQFQSDGVVPMLIIGMAEQTYLKYPAVRYFIYGTFFGARTNMQRFKRKFHFYPHRVIWKLDSSEPRHMEERIRSLEDKPWSRWIKPLQDRLIKVEGHSDRENSTSEPKQKVVRPVASAPVPERRTNQPPANVYEIRQDSGKELPESDSVEQSGVRQSRKSKRRLAKISGE
jgi:hypothetical protein